MKFLDDCANPRLNGLWGHITKMKLAEMTKISELLAYFSQKAYKASRFSHCQLIQATFVQTWITQQSRTVAVQPLVPLWKLREWNLSPALGSSEESSKRVTFHRPLIVWQLDYRPGLLMHLQPEIGIFSSITMTPWLGWAVPRQCLWWVLQH